MIVVCSLPPMTPLQSQDRGQGDSSIYNNGQYVSATSKTYPKIGGPREIPSLKRGKTYLSSQVFYKADICSSQRNGQVEGNPNAAPYPKPGGHKVVCGVSTKTRNGVFYTYVNRKCFPPNCVYVRQELFIFMASFSVHPLHIFNGND